MDRDNVEQCPPKLGLGFLEFPVPFLAFRLKNGSIILTIGIQNDRDLSNRLPFFKSESQELYPLFRRRVAGLFDKPLSGLVHDHQRPDSIELIRCRGFIPGQFRNSSFLVGLVTGPFLTLVDLECDVSFELNKQTHLCASTENATPISNIYTKTNNNNK